jgi:hypothetical protein
MITNRKTNLTALIPRQPGAVFNRGKLKNAISQKYPCADTTESRTGIKETHADNTVHQQLHRRNNQQQSWKPGLTLKNLTLTVRKHTLTAKNCSFTFLQTAMNTAEFNKYTKEMRPNNKEPCINTKEFTNTKSVFANG